MNPDQLAAQARVFVATAEGYEADDPECHEVLQRALGLILVMAETLEGKGQVTVHQVV